MSELHEATIRMLTQVRPLALTVTRDNFIDYAAGEPKRVRDLSERDLRKVLAAANAELAGVEFAPLWSEDTVLLSHLIPVLQREIDGRRQQAKYRKREYARLRRVLRTPAATAWQMYFQGHLNAVRAGQ